MRVKSSLLRTWLRHSMLVVFDLGMDLVEVGVGRVLPSRDLDRDKPLFREVVPQDVGRIRETLENKKSKMLTRTTQVQNEKNHVFSVIPCLKLYRSLSESFLHTAILQVIKNWRWEGLGTRLHVKLSRFPPFAIR